MKYRILFFGLHALAGWASLVLAFRLRFYFDPLPFAYDEMLMRTLPLAMAVKAVAAEFAGLTRRLWRHASFRDVKPVFLGALFGSLLLLPLIQLMEGRRFPNGPLLLDFLLTLGFFTVIRFSGRFWVEAVRVMRGTRRLKGRRVLILGAGDQGELAWRFLQAQHRVLGFLDDRPEIQGRLLLGLPVLGCCGDLGEILKSMEVEDVVIALHAPPPEMVRKVFEAGSAAGCRVSLMPEISPASASDVNPIRELRMSDFLGREPVQLDPAPLEKSLGGMTVLVTGAGGSIGSELSRQIAALPVKALVLLDNAENALFEISEELKMRVSGPELKVVFCDIRFREDLEAVFLEHRPDVVYHAAACKHVPMMELHPLDAARSNVLGTRNVVEAAQAVGVQRFLHVSTDKAVEAEGVMGASKAWAERIARRAGYSCVRFGNVLGSNGSVIPLFEKQWDQQGHLQVTHREATRYFMTIEEAVLLMLHAEALQGRGEVYILDMGEPVKILDLARQMVRMRSMQHPETGKAEFSEEEKIRIVGLRPGERMHERLHTGDEKLEPTLVPKVNKLSGEKVDDDLGDKLEQLEQAVLNRRLENVRDMLLG